MPVQPVVIDDGGSTRIRRNKGLGDMDDLLDVHDPADVGESSSPDIDVPKTAKYSDHVINDVFTNILVAWIGKDGMPGQLSCAFNDKVKISMGLGQNIIARREAGNLRITVLSDNIEPLVGGYRRKKARRYTLVNSGSIEKIEVDNNPAPANPVYNMGADGKPIVPAGLQVPTVITSVVLT